MSPSLRTSAVRPLNKAKLSAWQSELPRQDEQKIYNSKHLDELREKALNTEVTKAEDRLFARLK